MAKYNSKIRAVEAVQWNRMGDAVRVLGVPEVVYQSIPRSQIMDCGVALSLHGFVGAATGLGQLVCPGMWIVVYNNTTEVLSDVNFKTECSQRLISIVITI